MREPPLTPPTVARRRQRRSVVPSLRTAHDDFDGAIEQAAARGVAKVDLRGVRGVVVEEASAGRAHFRGCDVLEQMRGLAGLGETNVDAKRIDVAAVG